MNFYKKYFLFRQNTGTNSQWKFFLSFLGIEGIQCPVGFVYIQLGNEILFKQIVPLFTGDDYVICKQDPEDDELVTDEFGILKAFDEVVVEGANLYDGKIIDRAT